MYTHARCPICKLEGEGHFRIRYIEVTDVREILKGFDLEGNPVWGPITIDSDGKSKYITCPACGFQGKPFQFNRNALKGYDK